jgi:hypothetical protein
MRKLIIFSATLMLLAPIGLAKADYHGGGAFQKDGKCWSGASSFGRDMSFGFWGPCAETASVATTTHARSHRVRSSSR